jgi:hypothetical protein
MQCGPRGPPHEQGDSRGKGDRAAENAALYGASASTLIAAFPPQRQFLLQIMPARAEMQFESSWQKRGE